MERNKSWMGSIIDAFLTGNLAVLLIIISIAAGAIALLFTPREEEPQIVVPVADVLVSYPGGSAEEVEKLVSSRLERLLYQIDGVEYVYSMSRPGMAVVTVRFYVGQDREESLIKLYNKIFQNADRTTPGIAGWIIKPVEIDDVPIVTAALYSDRYNSHELYRIAEETAVKLQDINNASMVTIHGGEKRAVRVYLDIERMAAYGLTPIDVMGVLKISNTQSESGTFEQDNTSIRVEAGPFLKDAREVMNLIVGLHDQRPVYLRDIATIEDGPDEVQTVTRYGLGPAGLAALGRPASDEVSHPAVTIAVAKKKGSNAVWVADDVQKRLDALRGTVIPDDVSVAITRNYGATANDKVNDLVTGLTEAIVTVIVLIALVMNWRVGIIVALAVPITYALTLLVNMLAGYTINRVTLFALILALGLLVDDPIVAVENIYRHLSQRKKPPLDAISDAMNEVMPPIVLSTLSVMVAFLPMFFITGMMGPYMRPMALNVPLAMFSSLLVSFMITPWVSSRMLKNLSSGEFHEEPDVRQSTVYRFYSRLMMPFMDSRGKSRMLMVVMGALFAGSAILAFVGVPLKLLPFDNKNEFQLLVDMPESATLEQTDALLHDLENYLRTQPEITDFTSYAGMASPMDFNGMVRHYYMRQGPHLADIRVNLLHRTERAMDSHAMVLRIRDDIKSIADRHKALVRIVETPPGPPVLASVVAEIYGQPHHTYDQLLEAARVVEKRMQSEEAVVEADVMTEALQPKLTFVTDREKAALNGISTEDIVQSLHVALAGQAAGVVHAPREQNELPIILQLPRAMRSDVERLKTLGIRGRTGHIVQLGELGHFEDGIYGHTIFHKNLERVAYVTAEMSGRGPAYAVYSMDGDVKKALPPGMKVVWKGEGEWKITVDVFRDLGLAFAAALLAIYVLLVYETKSYALPGIIMLSIPLTMIGIMPGFWLLNAIVNRPVGGYENPVFFTATAMIGMIALAGIVVRNGIILIDFIKTNSARGESVTQAVLDAGAIRLRPIVLTAGTTMLGAWPITLDPIFSGLAWSIIFGLFVSTAFTLIVVPVAYVMLYGGKES